MRQENLDGLVSNARRHRPGQGSVPVFRMEPDPGDLISRKWYGVLPVRPRGAGDGNRTRVLSLGS